MEEHEVFDSSLLKETINQLIATGKRNFAIDMSPMDYIYSDTINMLMALNRRVLDVTGRLSLMAPQPEVLQILKRAGIHNVLRVFETETDLMKSSEDMIMQTSSHQMSDIDAAKNAPPQSEFDQLRNEIGSVFDSGGEGHDEHAAPAHQGYSKPQQDDDFDQMFQQFEGGQNKGPAFGAGPQISSPQTPKFQPQQFSQPPSQPMPMRPSAPAQPQKPQSEQPQYSGDFSSVRPETQRFTSAPVPPTPPPTYQPSTPAAADSGDDEDFFETAPKSKPAKAPKTRQDFDSLDDDFDDEFKKKSPLPAILIVILILALGGAGAFVIYLATSKKKPQQIATLEKPTTPKPAAPQLPVATPDSLKTEDKDTVATPEPEPKEIVAPKPEIKKPPVRRSTPPPRRKPVTRRPSRPPAPSKPKTVNKVEIASSPSGAAVLINGKRMGTTPFTWKKPFFGNVTVSLSKTGYEDLKESFEFTGGTVKKSFTMKKAASRPPVATPSRSTPKPPPVASTPKRTPPPPPPVDDEDDPFADIGEEDDIGFDDEEPVAPPPSRSVAKPTTPTAPPPTRPSTPPASSGGAQASIFIASIPPVADVYLGDKLIGKTNVSELKIPAGVQTLKFVKGAKQITKQLTLKPGKNPSQMVRIP